MKGVDFMQTLTALCIMCHKTHYTHYLDQLKRIREWLKVKTKNMEKVDTQKLERELGCNFIFSHKENCKYGVGGCSTISSINTEHSRLVAEVKELFLTYLGNNTFPEIHTLYRLLQGYYPREYKVLERYYHTHKDKE